MAEADYPGDDYLFNEENFVEKVPETFSCPICFCTVQREAHLTRCCGHHFCFRCIDRIRSDRKPCPMCKERPVVIFPNKQRQREIKELRVRCAVGRGSAVARCTWEGTLGELTQHVQEDHGASVAGLSLERGEKSGAGRSEEGTSERHSDEGSSERWSDEWRGGGSWSDEESIVVWWPSSDDEESDEGWDGDEERGEGWGGDEGRGGGWSDEERREGRRREEDRPAVTRRVLMPCLHGGHFPSPAPHTVFNGGISIPSQFVVASPYPNPSPQYIVAPPHSYAPRPVMFPPPTVMVQPIPTAVLNPALHAPQPFYTTDTMDAVINLSQLTLSPSHETNSSHSSISAESERHSRRNTARTSTSVPSLVSYIGPREGSGFAATSSPAHPVTGTQPTYHYPHQHPHPRHNCPRPHPHHSPQLRWPLTTTPMTFQPPQFAQPHPPRYFRPHPPRQRPPRPPRPHNPHPHRHHHPHPHQHRPHWPHHHCPTHD